MCVIYSHIHFWLEDIWLVKKLQNVGLVFWFIKTHTHNKSKSRGSGKVPLVEMFLKFLIISTYYWVPASLTITV